MQKEQMTRYLLRQMPEDERQEFEDRYLEDNRVFEELVAAEEEMVRRYLAGAGSKAERKEFIERFLSTPSGQAEVEVTEALQEYAAAHCKPSVQPELADARRFSVMPMHFAITACVVMAAVCLWLVFENIHMRRELAQANSNYAGLRDHQGQLRHQLEQDLQTAQLRSPDIIMSPVTLTAHLIRNTRLRKAITVPREVTLVPLRLDLDRVRYPQYSASLENADEKVLWRKDGLIANARSKGAAIAVAIPKTVLPSGDYVLRLFGATSVGKVSEAAVYSFRVVNELRD